MSFCDGLPVIAARIECVMVIRNAQAKACGCQTAARFCSGIFLDTKTAGMLISATTEGRV
jgi:hypothetical protein